MREEKITQTISYQLFIKEHKNGTVSLIEKSNINKNKRWKVEKKIDLHKKEVKKIVEFLKEAKQ